MSCSVMARDAYLYIFIAWLFAAAAIEASPLDLCSLDRYPYLNATVSQTVPALQPDYSLHPTLPGNLTISTGVKKFSNESGDFTEQLFWMTSDPYITDPDNSLSFRTCAFFLIGLELSAINGTKLVGADPHNDSCSVALPRECEQTMMSGLRSNASYMFSNENVDISDTSACTRLAESALDPRSLPECSGYRWNIVGTSSLWASANKTCEHDHGCDVSEYNAFDGSYKHNTMLGAEYSDQLGMGLGIDFYAEALNTSVPVVLTAWPANYTNDPWDLGVRSVCLTPGAGVLPGSKDSSSDGSEILSSPGLAGLLLLSLVALALIRDRARQITVAE